MKIPTSLKHHPVIVVEDYSKIDGPYAGHTDAQGLSVGLAQWNDRGDVEVSAKVWRYTGEKWSRMSEELPLHRVIDLCILICKTVKYNRELYRKNNAYDKEKPTIDNIDVQGTRAKVDICIDNEMIDKDIKLLHESMAKNDEFLSERLHNLANLLSEIGYGYNKK